MISLFSPLAEVVRWEVMFSHAYVYVCHWGRRYLLGWVGGVPSLDGWEGYLPWMRREGGTYLWEGGGTYLGWGRVPTFDRRGVPALGWLWLEWYAKTEYCVCVFVTVVPITSEQPGFPYGSYVITTHVRSLREGNSTVSSGESKGTRGTCAPLWPKISLFSYSFRKNWPSNRLAPPFGVNAPSSRKSWIRHWYLGDGVFLDLTGKSHILHPPHWSSPWELGQGVC